MNRHRFFKFLKFAPLALLFGALFVALFAWVVMHLWNWLMPAVFGLHVITFWQALAMLILSKILLGGSRCGPGRGGISRRTIERWEQMTPEEREKFRQSMRGPCGS